MRGIEEDYVPKVSWHNITNRYKQDSLEAENEQLYDLLDKWKHNSMQWKNLFIGVSIMLIGHMIALAIILIKGA